MIQPADLRLEDARGVTPAEPVPPAEPGGAWFPWLTATIISVLLLAVFLLRRRRKPAVPLPPEVAAEKEIEVLRLADQPDVERLDRVLREFLRRYFELMDNPQTTPELTAALKVGSALPTAPELVGDAHPTSGWHLLLTRLDLARFAGVSVSADEWTTLLNQTQTLIQEAGRAKQTAVRFPVTPGGENA